MLEEHIEHLGNESGGCGGQASGQVSVGVGLEGHWCRAYSTHIGPQLLSDARQRESSR